MYPAVLWVIDTADWAERLCIEAICAKFKVKGIEDLDMEKDIPMQKRICPPSGCAGGSTAGREAMVVTAHATIARFEQPDAVGEAMIVADEDIETGGNLC